MKQIFSLYYKSPIGVLEMKGTEKELLSVLFVDEKDYEENPSEILIETKKQIGEYFNHKRKIFTLNYTLEGSEFQNNVWKALTDIDYGSTASYKDIAKAINNEKACRAVGMANSKNILPIIVPCHRIIGSNNSLTGYAGGLWRKKWLLEHEQK